MTSGMLAAQAISGAPADAAIAGLEGPTGFPDRPHAGVDGGNGAASLCGTLERGVGQVAGPVAGVARELRRWLRP